ncbi:MAG: HD domain-containing protein [Bacillota bacterium]
MNKNYKLGAVIYLGSRAIYLKIAEKSEKGKMKILENLKYPLNLGQDTFNLEKITPEKIEETCKIINGFLDLISEYKVSKTRAIATTAIKEAKNRDYILDQINVKTGIKFEVFNDVEEKNFIYKKISRVLDNKPKIRKAQNVIAYIGTGSLGVAIYRRGNILSSQHIRVGSLKLSEILKGIQNRTDKFYIVVKEYLSGFTYMLKKVLPQNNIDNLIITGKEINLIKDLCNLNNNKENEINFISKKEFLNVYDKIKEKTPNQVMNEYNLSSEDSELLLPSMTIYKTILEITNAKNFITSTAFISDILLQDMFYPDIARRWNNIFDVNTILSAINLGKKYQYNKAHADAVERYSLTIFDSLKSIHGLNERARLFLQVAAILHDIGKFMSLKGHYYYSYDIIIASNILGLTEEEKKIVANIAKYHSSILPNQNDDSFKHLSSKNRLLVSKLTAILRLGDALDKSHRQKISKIRPEIKNKKLVIKAFSDNTILLEEWTIKQKSALFYEVFGLKVDFKKVLNI